MWQAILHEFKKAAMPIVPMRPSLPKSGERCVNGGSLMDVCLGTKSLMENRLEVVNVDDINDRGNDAPTRSRGCSLASFLFRFAIEPTRNSGDRRALQ
jgi:hypothetical protein